MFLIITFIDQIIKYFVEKSNCNVSILGDVFNLIYAQNTGAMYGSFKGGNAIIAFLSFIILITLGIYVYKNKEKDKIEFIIWQFVLGGGVSNLIDRMFRGYVVDFIQLKFFGIFNLSDACIVLGIISIIFLELKGNRNEAKQFSDK